MNNDLYYAVSLFNQKLGHFPNAMQCGALQVYLENGISPEDAVDLL